MILTLLCVTAVGRGRRITTNSIREGCIMNPLRQKIDKNEKILGTLVCLVWRIFVFFVQNVRFIANIDEKYAL